MCFGVPDHRCICSFPCYYSRLILRYALLDSQSHAGIRPAVLPPMMHQAPVSFTALCTTKTSFTRPPVCWRLVPGSTGEIATDRTRVASAAEGAISTSGLTNWRCRTLQSGPVEIQRLVTVKLNCRLYLLINRLVGIGSTILPRISSSLSSAHPPPRPRDVKPQHAVVARAH